MTTQTAVVTRLVRARTLVVGDILIKRVLREEGFVDAQVVLLDLETYPDLDRNHMVVSAIGVDDLGEQILTECPEWGVVTVVVSE